MSADPNPQLSLPRLLAWYDRNASHEEIDSFKSRAQEWIRTQPQQVFVRFLHLELLCTLPQPFREVVLEEAECRMKNREAFLDMKSVQGYEEALASPVSMLARHAFRNAPVSKEVKVVLDFWNDDQSLQTIEQERQLAVEEIKAKQRESYIRMRDSWTGAW